MSSYSVITKAIGRRRVRATATGCLLLLFSTVARVPAQSGPARENDAPAVPEHAPHRPIEKTTAQHPTRQTRTPDTLSKSWDKWEHATGDWAGLRPWLDAHGFILEAGYAADFFYNLRGGRNTHNADAYRGLFSLSLTVDTEAAGLWKGGTFFLNFQEIHGRDISERHVGDLQALNNDDAPRRTQLAEYWYEHSLLNDKLRIKLGKMDANADFGYVDFGLEFINSSAGINPVLPIPTYPDPALGVAVFVEPVEWLYVAGGVYDANGLGDRTGFDTTFHNRNDSVTIVEMGVRPSWSVGGQVLPGTYRIGGWYHSGDWDVFFDDRDGQLPPRTHRGNAGVYLDFDQCIYRENPEVEDDAQGLGIFFQFAWAPSAYNEISSYYGFGAQYVGLLPTRDEDVTGVGLFHTSLSGRLQALESRFSETAIELFHKFQWTPWFSIKPDVQYIVNPGGDGRDAFVAGIRMETIF